MPWHKQSGHPECPSDTPWAVVKDDDGAVEGCHATEADADAQLAALYASESGDGADADSTDSVVRSVYSQYPLPIEAYSLGKWRGILAVEGIETGDWPRRMFAENSLTWRDLPVSLEWQPKTAPEHDESVIVSRIDAIERDGKFIRAEGQFDMAGENGIESHRLVHGGFLRGVSVMIDDVEDNDVEMVWPEVESTGDPELDAMNEAFAEPEPELVILNHGRILNANLTSQPAMQEAFLELIPDNEMATPEDPPVEGGFKITMAFSATPEHETATSDEAWDAAAQETNLPESLGLDVVNSTYAWYDEAEAVGDTIPKSACRLLHHVISVDGTPGDANLTAVSAAIGALNGSRGGADVPEADRQGVYDHLAKHLRDAGQEPPPLTSPEEAAELQSLVAAMSIPVNPDEAWFQNPKFKEPTPWTVLDDGRCFGHLATKDRCHTSFMGQCITAPAEAEFSFFTTGELVTKQGTRVPVGKLTFGTNHAPGSLGARPAAEHYEHTGYVAADVAAGNDRFGIWVAGAVRPDLTAGQLRALRAAAPSGDWRRIGGRMRLVAGLMVNVPGFPVPRTRTYIHDGVQSALVASGVLTSFRPRVVAPGVLDRIASSVGRDRRTRAEELRARVHPK